MNGSIFRWRGIQFRHFSIGLYEFCAAVLLVLAVSLRVLLAYLGWPNMDSDEGTMGLMARHVAYRGEHPIFFYGQPFMGSLEAYLGAAFFRLSGSSLFALRLGVIVLFACFLVTMYFLTSLLYTKKLALVTLVLLSLGSSEILFHQLEAAGGYPETMLFGALLLLYASGLALSSGHGPTLAKLGWRNIAYGDWGVVVGLALWSDPLVLPFVVMAGLLLIFFCHAELRRSTVLSLLLGLVIGLLPVIVYNLTVPLQQGSWNVVGAIFSYGSSQKAIGLPSLGQRIIATILVSLPVATGVNPLCPLYHGNAWPLSGSSSRYVIQCTVVHGAWGLGFIILWTVAVLLTIRYYWKLRLRSKEASWSAEERQVAIRRMARLMLLGSAGLTVFIFAISAPSGQVPWPASRYLVGVLIATPALLWPLWGTVKWQSGRFTTVMGVLRYGVLLLIGTTFLLGTVNTFRQIPSAQAGTRQQLELVHDLMRIGATRIYSDYWTCDRIIFQSEEQIICSVVNEQLQPDLDRYLPYRAIVNSDPHPAYAFPVDSAQAVAFAQKVGRSGGGYQRFNFDGYMVYVPG